MSQATSAAPPDLSPDCPRRRIRWRRIAGWLLWTLATTASPPTAFAAWLVAAWRTRRPRMVVTACLYLIWPLVGVIGAGVMSAMLFAHHLQLRELGVNMADGAPAELLLAATWVGMWIVSVVNAQIEWWTMLRDRRRRHDQSAAAGRSDAATGQRRREGRSSIDDDALPSSRPYWVCLVMWITLGWTGAHRFYTGKWVTGALYMFTLGLVGVGWAADLFLLRRLLLAAPQLNGVEQTTPLAPWAGKEERYGWLDFGIRLAFFLTAPFVFVELCVYFHHLELLAVLVVSVVICGLLGNLERVVGRLGVLEKIPITRPAASFFRDLHTHYYHHQPRPFLYYVLLPVIAPVAIWVSPRSRGELWLYAKFLLTLFAIITVQQLQSYGDRYRYMSYWEVAGWLGFHLGFATLVTVVFLIPIVTTSFNLNLSGKLVRLRTLSVLLLATTLPLAGLTFYMVNHLKTPTWVSWMMLESRIESLQFRQDLQIESEIFLRHFLDRVPPVETPHWTALHSALTDRYQAHVSALVEEDESRAFQVRLIAGAEDAPPSLAVVRQWRLGSIESSRTIFLMTPEGQFYSRWERLPPQAKAAFQAIEQAELEISEYRLAQRSFREDVAIYDTLIDFLWREAGALQQHGDSDHPAFQEDLTHALRQTLRQEGIAGAEEFRVFGWDDGPDQWIGVRDSRQAWLLAHSTGRFIERWDEPGLPHPSHDRVMLMRIEEFDPVAALDFNLPADQQLARDLVGEHSLVFLTEAARWRQHESLMELSASYRDFIAKLVPEQHLPRFQVVQLESDGGWLGIAYGDLPLFAASPAGDFYQRGAPATAASQTARAFLSSRQLR